MKRNLGVLVLMLASAFIFLPADSRAADVNSAFNNNVEYTLFLQRGRGRGRGRGWDDDRRWRRGNRSWNRNRYRTVQRRGFRLVRQTYWRNGRRYTRVVRVY